MKITAVIAFRNEEKYLGVTLRHLVEAGIRLAIIDNDSTDRSPEIVKQFGRYIDHHENLPFHGRFNLTEQIEMKSRVIQQLDTNWVIHQDADEILQSPRKNESLKEGIERVEMEGCTAINFDEFVFVPTLQQPSFEGGNFFKEMLYYYFFESFPNRLMRAWKNIPGVFQENGGHALKSVNPLAFPSESFLLRHYIVLSQKHSDNKYAKRLFAEEDLNKNWHQSRVNFPKAVHLPDETLLHKLDSFNSKEFVKSSPCKKHFWEINQPDN